MNNATEISSSCSRAAERIIERHRKLSYLQKRGGRKGTHTRQVRYDYLLLTVHRQIRVDELFPKAWREKLPAVMRQAAAGALDVVIGPDMVLVTVPRGGTS